MFFDIETTIVGSINRLWPSPNPIKTHSRAEYNQALLIFEQRLTYITLFAPNTIWTKRLIEIEMAKRRFFIEENQNRTGEDLWRILHTDIEPKDAN